MNVYLLALIIFVLAILVIEMLFLGLRTLRDPNRSKVRKKLRNMAYNPKLEADSQDIVRKTVYSEIKALDEVLRRISVTQKMQRLLYQANASYALGFYLILAPLLGLVSYFLLSYIGQAAYVCLLVGLGAGLSPFLYLRRKKKKRMQKFEAQLPEALDLLARSLKAGHAFTTGLKLAADEFDDPMGPELNVVLDEINFGVPVPDALRKMTLRVDCPDLNFFVVAVIMQRETGGNLAQIIESIASLIRERFKFFGKVRALVAEGVLSMWVLLALPFFIVGILSFLNPEYMGLLFEERMGQIMMGGALFMMLLGYFFMRNMVRIKV